MYYNFDKQIDREHTNCTKYDGCKEIFGAPDLIPLWVADMDFCTPDFVFDAIEERLKHPFLGYFIHSDGFYKSIINWMQRRHDWKVEKDWIYFATGVMPSLFFLIQAFTAPGDKVLVQPPVYGPLCSVINNQGREIVRNPLKLVKDHYEMDFNHFEYCLRQGVKVIILCNPHNPLGRCWSKGELKDMGDLCLKYNCLIVSDEIHSDLIMPGYKHTPIANISEEISQNSIVCMSPSKTFNLAGLSASEIIIPNASLRRRFEIFKQGTHLFAGDIFGELALERCYTAGDEWLSQLVQYLKENVDYIQQYIKSNLSEIKTFRHEATYLPWLDFSDMGLSHEHLSKLLVEKAKIALTDGANFGKEGELHFRINIACPRRILEKSMNLLRNAFCT